MLKRTGFRFPVLLNRYPIPNMVMHQPSTKPVSGKQDLGGEEEETEEEVGGNDGADEVDRAPSAVEAMQLPEKNSFDLLGNKKRWLKPSSAKQMPLWPLTSEQITIQQVRRH